MCVAPLMVPIFRATVHTCNCVSSNI
jgi:hypothetical protein